MTTDITFEQGVVTLKADGFDRVKSDFLSSDHCRVIHVDDYSALYTLVFKMCTQRPHPHIHSERLYNLVAEESAKVAHLFPPGSAKREAWVGFFGLVFNYLDRFYVKRLSLPDVRTSIQAAMTERDVAFARAKRRFKQVTSIVGLIAYWRHLAAMPDATGMRNAAKRFQVAASMQESSEVE